jgi:lysophospholipase L1-like esterase
MRIVIAFIAIIFIACGSEKDEVTPIGPIDSDDSIENESDTLINTSGGNGTLDNDYSQNGESVSFLALGDSYTAGTGEKSENRWPVLLADRLAKSGYNIDDPRIIATTGWTTGNLITAIENQEFSQKYDMVSLLIGVNNQYQGLNFNVFEEEFLELLSFAQETSKSKGGVFVLSIPDYGVTPFGQNAEAQISQEIDQYNEYIKKVCDSNNIKFYNITEISRKAKNDLSYLASDQLHPSKQMYEEWINLIISDPPEYINN